MSQNKVTPNSIKDALVAEYNGLVKDMDNFKSKLIVERDPSDANRLNVEFTYWRANKVFGWTPCACKMNLYWRII